MKHGLITALLLAASSYALAFAEPNPEPAPEPVPSIEGLWEVTSRSCSSNAPLDDNVKIGKDKLSFEQRADQTFEFKMDVGGCLTTVTGTYVLEGLKATYTSTSAQGCKDTAPVPMNDTYSTFFAYLGATEAVTVTTGDKAALSCPAGDALILNLTKQEPPAAPF